jgi:hypothetical protein
MRVAIHQGHVVDVIRCELDDGEQHRIAAALAEQGIRVEPVVDVFHTLHLWPAGPLSTVAADTAIRAFAAATDCRIHYHDRRPALAPVCLLCPASGELTHGLCDGCAARIGAVAS